MTKKLNDKKKSLKGVVLIMVVTVMFVLIIMLMATLSVVSTAQNRYYTKFEENQAYYTARSALDVFTNNMLKDSDYYAYDGASIKNYIHDDNVTTDKMKQGLALQLDLYTIASQNGDNIKQDDLRSYANTLTTKKDEYKHYFGTDNTKVQHEGVAGDPDYLEYIEYRITDFPQVSSTSDNYGKMVDTVKTAGGTDQIEATIRVEVLDREFNIDETKITDGTFADRTALFASPADAAEAIVNGTRSKDWMRLKITATVTFMGTESTAVLIYDTNEKDPPTSNQALTTTGGFSGGAGAQVRTAGGVASMDIGTSAAGDGNNMSGSIFTLGSLQWVSTAETKLNKEETIVAMDGIVSSSNPTKVKANGDGCYVFLGGTSYINNESCFGDSARPVNVIADTIVKTDASTLKFYGDVYVTTFDYQCGNPNKVETYNGNMYVKNLVVPDYCVALGIGDYTLNFDNLSKANIKLCSGYTISTPALGDITAVCNFILGDLPYVPTVSDSGFDINAYTAVKDADNKIYRQYTLPFQINGNNTIDVPTAQANFSQYYKDGAFHEETGELKDFNNPGDYDPAQSFNDYTNIYGTTNKNSWLLTGADLLADYLELPELNPGDPSRSLTTMLTDGTIATVSSMPSSSYEFDLSAGDQFYALDKPYYNNCEWKITGDNGRLILIIPEDSRNFGKSLIGGTASATVGFDNCRIITDDIDLSTTDIVNGTTKAPNVDIYGGTGAYITTSNNNLFCGYIMMPTGFVYLNNGKINVQYEDGQGYSTNINNVAIVGSLLCQEFTESNQSGIVYLDKDSGDGGQAGDPIHDFKSHQYARN